MSKPLPKSLHTVTVLVAVARREIVCAAHDDHTLTAADAVQSALATLGYVNVPDGYGLAAKATAILQKETSKPDRGAARTVGTWDGMTERPGYC